MVQDFDKFGVEGVKWMCSLLLCGMVDQEVLWQVLVLGDLQIILLDYVLYCFDEMGKLCVGFKLNFKQIVNGLLGFELRLLLLFDVMVLKGKLGLEKFVDFIVMVLVKIYNLYLCKGLIVIGVDVDIVIWDLQCCVEISDVMMYDFVGYMLFVGCELQGWFVIMLLCGCVIVDDG